MSASRARGVTLVLIAKEPLPGKAKTRLHPPLSLEQAAGLAAASISDTIAIMQQCPAARRILYFDGDVLPEGAENFEVLPQCSGDLDERLALLFDICDGPTVLIGMDTPQLTVADLAPVFSEWPGDAWFGPANDGGFWALGMKEPRGDLIRGVPMSREDTGAIQYQRLADAGLTTGLLPRLTDVDTFADAARVATMAPFSAFASAFADAVEARAQDARSVDARAADAKGLVHA